MELIASTHITVARLLAWLLTALVLAGVLTLVHGYRSDPHDELASARRFWGIGLLGTIALAAVAYLLGGSWGAPALPVGFFAALTIERHRERRRRRSAAGRSGAR